MSTIHIDLFCTSNINIMSRKTCPLILQHNQVYTHNLQVKQPRRHQTTNEKCHKRAETHVSHGSQASNQSHHLNTPSTISATSLVILLANFRKIASVPFQERTWRDSTSRPVMLVGIVCTRQTSARFSISSNRYTPSHFHESPIIDLVITMRKIVRSLLISWMRCES